MKARIGILIPATAGQISQRFIVTVHVVRARFAKEAL
jgi:hypothetical protein